MTNIPTGRKETTLGEVINIIGGWTPKTTTPEYRDGHIPWLSVVDFNNENRRVSQTEKTITNQWLENSSTKLLHKWDIIISARWTVGALGQLKKDMAFNQSCYGIKEKEWISDKNFLFYLIKKSTSTIGKNVHGAVFDTITRTTFDHISIVLPPLPEQKAIADVLSSFDDKIELLREENKTLESLGQTLFRERFGKYTIDTNLPEWWRVGRLEEIIENYDSKRIPIAKDKRDSWIYPYYWATGINHYVKDFIFDDIYVLLGEDWSVMKENWKPFTQYVWWKIRVNNHAHVLQGKAWFSTEMIKIILDNTNIAPYISWAVQLKITQSNMNSIPVIIPTQKILKEFNAIIHPMFNKIRNNTEQIQSLSHTRDTLLPKLMSGEVRVEF